MTTHERAEKMIAERLGFQLKDWRGTSLNDWARVPYPSLPQTAIQPTTRYEIALWSEAVRLQEELLKKDP